MQMWLTFNTLTAHEALWHFKQLQMGAIHLVLIQCKTFFYKVANKPMIIGVRFQENIIAIFLLQAIFK